MRLKFEFDVPEIDKFENMMCCYCPLHFVDDDCEDYCGGLDQYVTGCGCSIECPLKPIDLLKEYYDATHTLSQEDIDKLQESTISKEEMDRCVEVAKKYFSPVQVTCNDFDCDFNNGKLCTKDEIQIKTDVNGNDVCESKRDIIGYEG